MKKQLLLITGLAGLAAMAFGGGIVTNTNQSAAWVRTMVRDASTDADAVYFNPAGLTKLNDGFHFSLNSQTVFQNKDVISNYALLNGAPKKYQGKVTAPVFPGFYATWKQNKLAVSFGFNPVGGGGGAEYKTGLPSFEQPLSDLVPALSGLLAPMDSALKVDQPFGYGFNPNLSEINGYSTDIYFKGTSVFFGYQLGISYELNEMFSVYGGIRYVSAKNTYKGYIHDYEIEVNPVAAPEFFKLPVAGSYTPGDYLRAVSGVYGLSVQQIGTLQTYAGMLDEATDAEVDVEEKGNGITPILGVNIALSENFNIGLKYEFKTKIDLKQSIFDGKDGGGMFVQDSTVHSDMPAMLSAGIRYRFIPKMAVSAGMHYYFDKDANYGKTSDATGEPVSNDEVMDNNFYELALSLEYNITDKFLVSGGYLYTNTGVTEDYQSDMSFSLPSSGSFGFGFGYKFTDNLMVNLGGSFTSYKEGEKNYIHDMSLINLPVPVKDTYYKDNLFFGIGLDFSF